MGINLMPNDGKVCTFDCLYCEAGYNSQGPGRSGLPSRERVAADLKRKLETMHQNDDTLDVITFSGNGEPTLHPDFAGIIEDTLALRNRYFPDAKVSVLSNSTRSGDKGVASALRKVDNNILKLDSAIDRTMRLLDRPVESSFTVGKAVEWLRQFQGQCIVQIMMVRGEHEGQKIDNTVAEEVDALTEACLRISPREVMLYSLDRSTPEEKLEKVDRKELEEIAARMRAKGLNVKVS